MTFFARFDRLLKETSQEYLYFFLGGSEGGQGRERKRAKKGNRERTQGQVLIWNRCPQSPLPQIAFLMFPGEEEMSEEKKLIGRCEIFGKI